MIMDKSTIIAKLREHQGELRAAGVEHISLFGSYARGTAVHTLSDVVADMLGVQVDLAPARTPNLKEGIREHAAREAILAF
jgi:hypothetical protein